MSSSYRIHVFPLCSSTMVNEESLYFYMRDKTKKHRIIFTALFTLIFSKRKVRKMSLTGKTFISFMRFLQSADDGDGRQDLSNVVSFLIEVILLFLFVFPFSRLDYWNMAENRIQIFWKNLSIPQISYIKLNYTLRLVKHFMVWTCLAFISSLFYFIYFIDTPLIIICYKEMIIIVSEVILIIFGSQTLHDLWLSTWIP